MRDRNQPARCAGWPLSRSASIIQIEMRKQQQREHVRPRQKMNRRRAHAHQRHHHRRQKDARRARPSGESAWWRKSRSPRRPSAPRPSVRPGRYSGPSMTSVSHSQAYQGAPGFEKRIQIVVRNRVMVAECTGRCGCASRHRRPPAAPANPPAPELMNSHTRIARKNRSEREGIRIRAHRLTSTDSRLRT